jgi:uncharacterized protein YbaR (Trm112 family)
MTTATSNETWVCERCKAVLPYDDEIPACIPIAGELCEDCATATKAKCMDCKREYPLADLTPEHPDWQGRTHDPERLLCEACDDARCVAMRE